VKVYCTKERVILWGSLRIYGWTIRKLIVEDSNNFFFCDSVYIMTDNL